MKTKNNTKIFRIRKWPLKFAGQFVGECDIHKSY